MSKFMITMAVPDGSGAPRMALYFAHSLIQEGHEVIMAHGTGGIRNGVQSPERAAFLKEVEATGVECLDFPMLSTPGAPGAVGKLVRSLRDNRVDAIVPFQPRDQLLALQAAARSGVPCVVSAQTLLRFWGVPPVRLAKRWAYRRALGRGLTLAVCSSPAVREELVMEYGVADDKAVVLPNGVDVIGYPQFSEEDRAQVRAEFGCAPRDLLIVNVGRIDRQKGQDVLIEAFSRLRAAGVDARLLIVGGVSFGSAQAELREYERSLHAAIERNALGDAVHMLGWRKDTPRLLSAADFYVHAARYEGLPLVMVEAMAARRPVVITDCCGTPPGFGQGIHGTLVRTEDAAALGEAMISMASLTPTERNRMGVDARALAETRYDIRVIGKEFVRLAEQAIT